MAIIDNPGYGDNRGAAYDIANGCFMNMIFKQSKKILIVLVI